MIDGHPPGTQRPAKPIGHASATGEIRKEVRQEPDVGQGTSTKRPCDARMRTMAPFFDSGEEAVATDGYIAVFSGLNSIN